MRLQTGRYIPPTVAYNVLAHLSLFRSIAENPNINGPAILIMQGPAGSGKTSTIRHLCNHICAPLYEIHGKDMVSQWEGQGTKALERKIIEAANDPSPFQPVVLLDDAEMGGLRVDERFTGTVNNNASSGWLMQFANNPRELLVESDTGTRRTIRFKRPPALILIVNNISALHSPLVREGRAALCTLDPRGVDLQRVIAGMFPKLSVRQAGQLVNKFPEKSVAFFAELVNDLAKQAAMNCARDAGFDFLSVDWKHAAASIVDASNGATYPQLVAAGEKLAAQSRNTNFVNQAKSVQEEANPLIGQEGFHNYGNGALHPANEELPQPHIPPVKI
ncbi:AAA family ATPase [uncultured Roseibium sp.]|uniref:AAA family ATPase n=1 Tax=uncultured Roseibium sp. TaxID=1936171 RepID=UPI00262AD1BB|nr:AAA family ATPase [uncultured Roseibium sp.]